MLLYCICLVVTIVFLKYSLWRKKYSEILPGVKPRFYNILGDLSTLIGAKDKHLEVMKLFIGRINQFRKENFMCIWITYWPAVFFLKPEPIKELLKSNKMLDKGWMYEWQKPLVGTSLVTSNGELWKSQKRLLTPCFHADIVRSFVATFNEKAQSLVAALEKETKKEFSEISEIITLCAVDIASETLFGVSIKVLQNENVQYLNCLRRNKQLFMYRIYTPWLWPEFIYWNTSMGKEFMRNVKTMHQVTREILEEKKARYLKGEQITLKGKRKAMLDLLLEKHLETKEMSEEDIRAEVNLFLIAGHETIGITTTYALFLLGHHPEIQAKVHEELDRVFGDDLERDTTEEDFQHLKYLECVLKETYRLYPGIPIFTRNMPEDTVICGQKVPKGAACVVFLYMLHRDPDVFPDPEKFDPDRFSPENIGKIPEFAYLPFSAGARNCIGYKFAEVELRIILSWILRHFTVESVTSRESVTPILSIGLHPSKPIKVKLRPRSNVKVDPNL